MSRPAFLASVLLALLATGFLRAAEPPDVAAMRAKAEKGNGLAQYNLGLVYATGEGVKADLPEAFVWLSLASENGATGHAMDRVLGNITDAQLAAGRRRLADYRAALAAKAALSARPSARRASNRGFSLTALPSIDPGINPEPEPLVTHPPEATAFAEPPKSPPAPPAASAPPIPDNPSQLKVDVVRLQTELARTTRQVQEQAAIIQGLQAQLSRRAAAPSPVPDATRTTPPDGAAPKSPAR